MTVKAPSIVCAVRGSHESRATVTRAIDLALETNARLTFFYVVDAEFQAQAAIGSPLSVIYQELVSMSEFALIILKDRAERRGVTDVELLIRQGDVRTQLLELVRERLPDVLVLGWPVRGAGRPRFNPHEFAAFVAELEGAGDLHVEVVPAPPVT